MRLHIKLLYCLAVLLVFVIPTWAEPDFSGTWKLNVRESNFGSLGDSGSLFGPDEAIRVIDQSGSFLKVRLFQSGGTDEITAELIFRTDGTECTNELEVYSLTSKMYWKGDNLLVKSHLEIDPFYPDLEDLWDLSEDGAKLTINRRLRAMSGADYQKLVFDKQELGGLIL